MKWPVTDQVFKDLWCIKASYKENETFSSGICHKFALVSSHSSSNIS